MALVLCRDVCPALLFLNHNSTFEALRFFCFYKRSCSGLTAFAVFNAQFAMRNAQLDLSDLSVAKNSNSLKINFGMPE